jgi:translation initiation factor IF-2
MNVSELVRKLNTTREEFLEALPELGFDIGRRAIKIDDQLVDGIVAAWNRRQADLKEAAERAAKEARTQEIEAERSKVQVKEQAVKPGDLIELPDRISVKDLAKALQYPVMDVMSELMKNGIMVAMNEEIDFETASIIAEDLHYQVKRKAMTEDEESVQAQGNQLEQLLSETSKDRLIPRPPVVVVMGHVDHGKTKLLDAIRKTNVVDQEAGGITQSIGAYQVQVNDRFITFIDTPGHEAFTAMRSRGAKVADIAILVVAADDGIKTQTKEALEIIKQAGLPFIVAINKIDKPEADVDRVKSELGELNLIPEDWGGKTITVPISAKQGMGITELLETIMLVNDLHQESVSADPTRSALGTIIESHVDAGEGPVATVIIQTGTLRRGDLITVGEVPGKVKIMRNHLNEMLASAPPSTPVRLLGLKSAPRVGDILQVIEDRKILKQKMKEHRYEQAIREQKQRAKTEQRAKDFVKHLPIMLKADTLGSLEVLVESLMKLRHPEVMVDVLSKKIGAITQADVTEAEANRAMIFGFNVHVDPRAEELARGRNIPIHIYSIIYELMDRVKQELEQLLPPEVIEQTLGKAKVLAVFKQLTREMIIGGKVIEGKMVQHAKAHVVRSGDRIGTVTIDQLQQEKKNVGDVSSGQEFGMKIVGPTVVAEGDLLEAFEEAERKRTLGF